MNPFKTACFLIAIAAVAIAFFVYPQLPETVITHWGPSGQPDGTGPAWAGAFLFPLIIAAVLLLFVIIPKIAVFKKNFREFDRQYWMLSYAILLFFVLMYSLTLLPNFGYGFNMPQVIGLPLGMLFISIGILLPSFKRNFFVGIRTPWSLANDKVWRKTHRFGGKAFILAGFVTLFSVPFEQLTITFSVGAVLVAAIASIVYSFLEFRKSGKVKL